MPDLYFGPSSPQRRALDAQEATDRRGWWRQLWSRREVRLEGIRQCMLAHLGGVADGEVRADLAVRIKSASDVEALWVLRHAWTEVLSNAQGEVLARQRLSDVSFMFAGLLDRDRYLDTSLDLLHQGGQARGLVRTATQLRTDH